MKEKFVNFITSKFVRPFVVLLGICFLVGYNSPTYPSRSSTLPAKFKELSKNRKFALKNLKTTTINFEGKNIQLYVVDNDATRTEGLMYVQDHQLMINQGMLFVYPVVTYLSFYMRNTYIPLDIAFITSHGYVLNIDQMQPLSLRSHWSMGPAKYVIEMKKGAFKKFGIGPGVRIKEISKFNTRV